MAAPSGVRPAQMSACVACAGEVGDALPSTCRIAQRSGRAETHPAASGAYTTRHFLHSTPHTYNMLITRKTHILHISIEVSGTERHPIEGVGCRQTHMRDVLCDADRGRGPLRMTPMSTSPVVCTCVCVCLLSKRCNCAWCGVSLRRERTLKGGCWWCVGAP